jgi:phospholipid/cholesterol/gamma-HCH transport system substrate-binding protein
MRPTRTVEISTGLFVLLGFASLFFLVTQITNRELSANGKSYEVMAHFEQIGSLKPGAAVSMAGVTVGRVESITYDQQLYKAVVRMRINSAFDRIPKDSDASIMTSGLLGGQYVGVTPGGAEEYLKQGDRIEFVQDAFVLENLINQLAATFLGRGSQGSAAEGGGQNGATQGDEQADKPGNTKETQEPKR